DVWAQGFTGKGIGVAVIDTGVYPHPDLEGRIVGFKDFVNGKTEPYDDNGHGSHVSGLVAGDGSKAGGKFKGTAPEANIIGVKVLDRMGGGSMANVIKGVQWCIENKDRYNIKVINMSLGAGSNQKEKDDIVALAVKACLDAGIVPVIAAGNSGPFKETIGTPAVARDVLTVGAYDDKNTPTLADDTMAFFSSRGPTTRDRNIKPDIASPGVQLVSLRSPGSMIDGENVMHLGDYYVLLSGTSMATPVAAGVVADVIQANPNLTPREVIQIIKETARPQEGVPAIMQGHGLIDPAAAVRRALQLKAEAGTAQPPAGQPPAPPASEPPAEKPGLQA
ncbi:MAG TPA: S8 family peptidase, partial [Candidatus Nitrosotenuis sp.]|nr:S8 family peptidase [Candidatus Nitrosotenuis sp.]